MLHDHDFIGYDALAGIEVLEDIRLASHQTNQLAVLYGYRHAIGKGERVTLVACQRA